MTGLGPIMLEWRIWVSAGRRMPDSAWRMQPGGTRVTVVVNRAEKKRGESYCFKLNSITVSFCLLVGKSFITDSSKSTKENLNMWGNGEAAKMTPVLVEVVSSLAWGSDSWQRRRNTPLLKNKDVSLITLGHIICTHATIHRDRECTQLPLSLDSCILTRGPTHKALWKLTPFGGAREESWVKESDGQALPSQLSANTIQRGHVAGKSTTGGTDWQRNTNGDKMGSLFSSRLYTWQSFTLIMTDLR